jgi:hypothetical protein
MKMLILAAQLCLVLAAAAQTASTDHAQLIKGVQTIASPGSPGRVCVFGGAAFPVVVGGAGRGVLLPAVGASRLGGGRVVAFGHSGYFDKDTLKESDTGKLLANALAWAAGGAAKPSVVILGGKGLHEALATLGFSPETADLAALAPPRVLVAEGARVKAGDVDAIVKFIRAGGGFITSATGWGWKQLNPGKELGADLALNRVLHAAGLAIADGSLSDTTREGFLVGANVPPLAHAGRALALAESSLNPTAKVTKADSAAASAALVNALGCLPDNDTALLPRVRALAAAPKANVIPTPKTPVKAEQLAARLRIVLQGQALAKASPEQTRAHPAAEAFPGPVPQSAPRLGAVTVPVDTTVRDWHSTGLYAAPGETVTVTIPAEAARRKLRIRIGAHKDELWHLDAWKRFPEITREWPLDAAVTKVACAFGGLIHVEVPKAAAPGIVPVQISGAVAAPFYAHGRTGLEAWRTTIRNHPAPWGELASSKVILTLPAEVLRTLDDPSALMDTWDRILDLVAELATIPKERERPERIVCDEQISAGYMHSGYPIMTWMDQPTNFASRASLLQGNWGIFHELGHNHQVGDWTFEGTGEVTCNLFSLYVMDKLCGIKPRDYIHGRGGTPVIQLHKKYFATGAPSYERWKADPFTALCLYAQLQDAFGWEAYQKVFAEYRALPAAERPRTEQDKRDQWMVRFSRTVGKNLGPFFARWGVPMSDSAMKSVAALPAWMPEGMQ